MVGGRIVKLDDGGLHLSQVGGASAWKGIQRGLGRAILTAAPYMMKGISIIGTAAMFMAGGGILVHGTPGAEVILHKWGESVGAGPGSARVGGDLRRCAGRTCRSGGAVRCCVSAAQRLFRIAKRSALGRVYSCTASIMVKFSPSFLLVSCDAARFALAACVAATLIECRLALPYHGKCCCVVNTAAIAGYRRN